MNIKKFFKTALSIVVATVTLSSCVHNDDWDTPPINCENRFAASTMSMADLVAMAPASGTIVIPNGPNDPEVIIDGYVVSNDEFGNFYKTISFQDAPANPTVGLQIEIDKAGNYADFPVGSHIRLKVNGLVLGMDRGTMKLGSVDPTYAIGRIPASLMSRYISGVCSGNGLDVQTLTPLELPNLNEAKKAQYINMLVKVPNVMFADSEMGKTYLDYVAGAGVDTDRNVVDMQGGTAIIRNSGFFAQGSTLIPDGYGDLTFVVSRYNTTWQMLIRSLDDVKFDKARPTSLFSETFDAPLTTNWTAVNVVGNQVWNIQQFGNPKPCAVMNGFAGGAQNNEDWLISNPISLSATTGSFTSAALSFDTDVRYGGNPLQVFITENYTGDPATTTWVELNGALDPDSAAFNTWTNSGQISLNAYLNKTVRIAFKYTSTTAAAATWEVDNVKVIGFQ